MTRFTEAILAAGTGNQSPNVGFLFRCFSFASDSGPPSAWPPTGNDDPQEKSALPNEAGHWSLATRRDGLIKIGAKVDRHGRYVTFQLAEVAVSRELFRKILSRIDDLRRNLVPA